MGIRGLTTYIANRSDYYFENYELHDTQLVIDGWSLCSQLYCSGLTHTNCLFGGDYDQFFHITTMFFNDLLRCHVTPLVILDGAFEKKKYSTLIKRFKDRLNVASNYALINQESTVVFALLLSEVFVDVMNKMQIKYFMCTFEADNTIAGLARILECPVLSYDSDFYIYGVEYIPFNTLDSCNVVIKHKDKIYVKRCKIFKTEKLFNRFKGLDYTLLPLASILLGNDYISPQIFINFFSRIFKKSKYNSDNQQMRIERMFNWLKNYTLNDAVDTIIQYLSPKDRPNVLQTMENIINDYLNISTYMLRPLGFDEELIANVEKNLKIYKYQRPDRKINNDNYLNIVDIQGDEEIHRKLSNLKVDNRTEESDNKMEESEDNIMTLLPKWFLGNYWKGNYPCYFISIIIHKVHFSSLQVENMLLPPAHDISIPILKKIFSLLFTLKKYNDEDDNIVQLITRDNNKLSIVNLAIPHSSVDLKFFHKLNLSDRTKIIHETLAINDKWIIDELPESWSLYIVAIVYWIQQKNCIPERTKIHLDCLLLAMIMKVIDDKIGYYRSRIKFEKKYSNDLARIKKEIMCKNESTVNNSIDLSNIIKSVSTDNCIAALPFFLDHITVDQNLKLYPDRFESNIVHVFAQFQSTLKHSMHLNALLDFVYTQPSPSDFFNGTLLYNFYNNLKTRENIDNYISTRLDKSPEIVKIFSILKSKILNILQHDNCTIDEGEKNVKKRRKKRKKNYKMHATHGENCNTDDNADDAEDVTNSDYNDPNNRFSFLTN